MSYFNLDDSFEMFLKNWPDVDWLAVFGGKDERKRKMDDLEKKVETARELFNSKLEEMEKRVSKSAKTTEKTEKDEKPKEKFSLEVSVSKDGETRTYKCNDLDELDEEEMMRVLNGEDEVDALECGEDCANCHESKCDECEFGGECEDEFLICKGLDDGNGEWCCEVCQDLQERMGLCEDDSEFFGGKIAKLEMKVLALEKMVDKLMEKDWPGWKEVK